MLSYVLIPLMATILLVATGAFALALGPDLRANWRGAILLLLGAFWAGCVVMWNVAPDAAAATAWHRLATPGFVFVGPLALAFAGEITVSPLPHLRRLLRLGFALSSVFLVLGWTTSALLAGVERTPWGWGLVPGPLFGLWVAMTTAMAFHALHQFRGLSSVSRAAIDRDMSPFITGATLIILVSALLSDGILPIVGVQVPRIGSFSLGIFGLLSVWGLSRFGYSQRPERALAGRIIRTLPDGLILTSLNGRISLANRKFEQLIGCRPGHSAGFPVADLLDVPLLDPPREVTQLGCELEALDGTRLPVRVSSSRLFDEKGADIGLVVIISDQREIETLRNQVALSDRLAAVGQLAAGIAHELNNPLAFVKTNIAVLERELGDLRKRHHDDAFGRELLEATHEWDELLEDSLEGLDRAATIVRDIRDFSHAGRGERQRVDLSTLLDQVLRMAMPQFKGRVNVLPEYPRGLFVDGQAQRLKQLFLNLVVNAAQAIEDSGQIRVAATARDGLVRVDVEDDGVGVPGAERERIFDLFFTTKEVGIGTGLGLPICHEIVRAHGGRIWVEDRPGGGSIFRVELSAEAGEAG